MRMTRKSVADHQTGLDCVLFNFHQRASPLALLSVLSAPHRENRDWENILRPLPPPLRWKFRRCRTTRGGRVNRKIGSNALHGQIWSECVIYAVTNMYNVRIGLARCHNMLCVTCCHDQIKATIYVASKMRSFTGGIGVLRITTMLCISYAVCCISTQFRHH